MQCRLGIGWGDTDSFGVLMLTGLVRLQRLRPSALALLALGILTGCSESRSQFELQEAGYGVYPANYRSELLAFMHTYLNDPTGVRDGAIAEPVKRHVGSRDRYVVCVRYDSKNIQGRYNGVKTGMALFRNGRFDQFIEQPREVKEPCSQADFKPFSELERMER